MNADEIVKALRLTEADEDDICGVDCEDCMECPENDLCYFPKLAGHAADLIESLQSQLAEAERRERAAVEDLQRLVSAWRGPVAAKEKKEAMLYVQTYITLCKIKPVQGFAEIKITCYEKNYRRDADNVMSGASKAILDALQAVGIIVNDSRKYIKLVLGGVEVDKENPRVEVEIGESK